MQFHDILSLIYIGNFQKMAFSAIILLGYCGTSFVVSSYQESVKDSLSVN